MVLTVDREQVQAYRIATQELHRAHGDLGGLAVLGLGVQDAQQVSARLAIAARLDVEPGALAGESFAEALTAAEVTLAWSHRGAPHLHHVRDLPQVAAAMVPLNDADAQARLSWQRTRVAKAGVPATEALTAATTALNRIVDKTMTKGAASEAVTKVLPEGLVDWCRGCQATHIHEQLMRLATLRAGIRLEPDVSPATLTPIDSQGQIAATPDPAACTRVVEQYLHLHGPATLTEAAGFMTTTKGVAKDMWPGELADVELNGKRVFLAQQDISALENPPEPDFVRLLPPSDPLLQARDRLTLVPDKANRKAIWRIIGNPGVVLDGGENVATWRAVAKGRKRLGVTVSPLWMLRRSVRAAVETEAARVAGARDFDAIAVTFE